MPRPKRPKVVHTVPILRGGKPTATSTAQKQSKDISPASSGRVTNATDDSDGLVTTQRDRAGARRRAAVTGEFTMQGALDEGETGGTRLRPPSKRTIEEVTRIAREAEYASLAADRRRAREIAAAPSSDNIQIPSTLLSEASTRPASRAALSAMHSRRPSIVSRGQQTPLAHSSSLGAAMFKKRPRQPSLLQMVQSQNVQSELEDEDEDLYDFRPDDESTPIVKSLSQSHALGFSSSSRQTSGSRKRKLASPEIQVPASQSENIASSPSDVLSQPLLQDEASDAGANSDVPEPVLPEPHASQTPALDIFSDTLAPPQSSSSPPPAKNKGTATRKASAQPAPHSKRSKQTQPKTKPTTHQPDSTTSTATSPVRQPLKPITTASLQNLLPRRRTRHKATRGAYDFPSSSDIEFDTTHIGEEEDELSFHAGSKMRRKTKTPARTMQPQKIGSKSSSQKRKEAQATAEKGKRVSRTYTRKSLVESDAGSGDEDENDSLMPVKTKGKGKGEAEFDGKAKKEMERLAAKFAEVDEYALEFEDMTGSSSQMVDAR